ncbi:hypothetical protein C8322_04745 [Acinetobacter sp. SM1B]|nr:hypothetical protein C8322_04745 [Acinetobacter sp. SM1B]
MNGNDVKIKIFRIFKPCTQHIASDSSKTINCDTLHRRSLLRHKTLCAYINGIIQLTDNYSAKSTKNYTECPIFHRKIHALLEVIQSFYQRELK